MVNFNIRDLEDVPGHIDWLHPSELNLYTQFRVDKRRNDWLLGRWTAKELLQKSSAGAIELNKLAILPGENRAPQVFQDDKRHDLTVSISHSHQKSFCICFPPDQLFGCDLELIEKRSEAFYTDYFSPIEQALCEKSSENFTKELFFTLCWSAKEALMKATRKGMSIHPRKIEIHAVFQEAEKEWNSFLIEDTSESSEYYGKWKSMGKMIYTTVGREKFELLRI